MTISIVIPITRRWAIKHVQENLNTLYFDDLKVEVLFYVDSNDAKLITAVKNIVVPRHIKNWQIHVSNNQPPLENKTAYRRNRIVDMKHQSAKLVPPCDYVFSFEDDTILNRYALTDLLADAMVEQKVGFIQGIQAGRWDLAMLGAWRVDNIQNTKEIYTMELEDGLHNVDAGGFYCYLTRYDLYTTLPYSWHDECFGPDVMYGLEVRRSGFQCLTNFDIVCGHALQNGSILYPTGKEVSLQWKYYGGQWRRQFTFLDAKNAYIETVKARQTGQA